MTTESPTPADIDEVILAIQGMAARGEIVVRKKKDGQVGNQRTKYADLIEVNAQVLAALNELGTIWKCRPTNRLIQGPNGQQDVRFVLAYSLKHVASGTSEDGDYPLPAGANPMQNGSAITYGRRYALLAVTGIAAEDDDDDGNGYAGRGGMAQRANARQRPAQPAGETAQRAAPAPRAERARPAQQPEVPQPQRPAAERPRSNRDPNGPITGPMMTKLAIQFGEADVTDREERLALCKDMVGREIKSAKELTFGEGQAMIDAFEKAIAADKDTAAVTVTEIYLRTTGPTPDGGAPGPETVPTGEGRATAARRPPARKAVPVRSRAEQVTGRPDPSAGPAPWEDDGTLLDEPPAEG